MANVMIAVEFFPPLYTESQVFNYNWNFYFAMKVLRIMSVWNRIKYS